MSLPPPLQALLTVVLIREVESLSSVCAIIAYCALENKGWLLYMFDAPALVCWVVYLSGADNCDRPLRSRLPGVNQAVIMSQLRVAGPASARFASSRTPLPTLSHDPPSRPSQRLGLRPRRHAKSPHRLEGPAMVRQPASHGRHPARLRGWSCGVATWRVHPWPLRSQHGRHRLSQAIGQAQRYPVRRQPLHPGWGRLANGWGSLEG
jgi:hypothetical protein